MKDKIHPKYVETTISCACGNVVKTRSTRENMTVDLCAACHPFFTGKQKLVDTAGRVEKFRRKYGDVVPKTAPKKPAAPKKAGTGAPAKKAPVKKAAPKKVPGTAKPATPPESKPADANPASGTAE